MRNVPPFRCEGCGAESDYPSYCDACEQLYADAAGRPNVRPYVERRDVTFGNLPVAAFAAAFGALMGFGAVLPVLWFPDWSEPSVDTSLLAMSAVPWAVATGIVAASVSRVYLRSSNRRNRRTARHAIARLPLRPIAEHEDGGARIRGRVHVLRPAADEAANVGACLRRSRVTHTRSVEVVTKTGRYTSLKRERRITETSECGRFAVVDDTGVAIVDDDAFLVWSRSGRGLPPHRDGAFLVRDGEHVEVIGPARRGRADDARTLAAARGGYRDGDADALLFDGSPEDRVVILVGAG